MLTNSSRLPENFIVLRYLPKWVDFIPAGLASVGVVSLVALKGISAECC